MLQNLIANRLSGSGFIVPTGGNLASMSSGFGAMSRDRRDALDILMAGPRRLMYQGSRLDSATIKGDTPAARRKRAYFDLLAAEHIAQGSGIGALALLAARDRMDAAIPMASQGLISIYSQVYEIEHSGLSAWDKMILPIDTTVDPAAEKYSWYERDLAGTVKAASSYDTTTIPMVNGPVASANIGNIVPALVGWETNFMTNRRERLAVANGKPDFQIEAGKIETAKRVIAEFFNALWLYGDTALQIDGIHSTPLVGVIAPPPAVWSGLTVQQQIAELSKLFNFIPNRAQGGLLSDIRKVRVLLPPAQYDIITTPTSSVGSVLGPSPWASFRDSHKLKDDQIVKVYEFAAANSEVYTGGPMGLTRDRAYVVYLAGNIDDPHFILSQPIETPAAPRNTGVGEVTYMHARGGGIKIADARRIAMYEGL